ncbi:MAG: ice-binding family protein [Ferruginibacter sp.]
MKKMLPCIVTAFALLFSPLVNFAQAPNLGTASDFVLFTTVGAVGNTGISQLTGNVGTNSGSNTGFGNVNGVMHSSDGATLQASTDVAFAYTQLNNATANFNHAPLLGNGDTLVAGVYDIAGETVLSSVLTLNGQGNANAVFIFKISAAFSTNAASKVKLINEALACNVFWKIEGAVNIASETFMVGTIIANNGAISMNVNDTLQGRALSTSGAIAVDGVLAYTPTGCGSPLLAGPAAPVLGAADCFALFSGNGSVANSGTTNVTGDVGTNVGLTTGFDALLVNGSIHPSEDGTTADASTDLVAAYDYLNLLPPDIELLFPAQFGSNLVLTPHTYIMNSAVTFTDSLYLNAQGSANAVFVIKIKGAMNALVNSKVLLINSAQAKNVYWVVDGAVGIHDNSIFNGTVIVNNGAIDLTTGVTLNGRALTTDGALSTAGIIITSPSGACTPVPVTWLYFRGKPVQKNVLLEWGTSNEMNNGLFTIEKSIDGRRFESLTTVNATKAIGTAEHNYSFTDPQPFSLSYYRMSQTDKDGQRNEFKTIQVKMNMSAGFKAVPYVRGNYIYVQASGAVPGNGSIELYSMDGKKMSSQKVMLTKEGNTYKIDKALSKGMYMLNIQGRGERLYNGKVMVL